MTEKFQHLRRSNFFITLNTNKRLKPDENGLSDFKKFQEAMRKMMIKSNLKNFVEFVDEEENWNLLQSVNVKWVPSVSLKRGLLHVHILFCTSQYTKLRLDFAMVQKMFSDILEKLNFGKSGYTNFELIRTKNTMEIVQKNYIPYLDRNTLETREFFKKFLKDHNPKRNKKKNK